MALPNEVLDKKAVCKLIWYKWDVEVPKAGTSEVDLAASKPYDLSNHLVDSLTYSKGLESPAGGFVFSESG